MPSPEVIIRTTRATIIGYSILALCVVFIIWTALYEAVPLSLGSNFTIQITSNGHAFSAPLSTNLVAVEGTCPDGKEVTEIILLKQSRRIRLSEVCAFGVIPR